jgi:hypothetical protein
MAEKVKTYKIQEDDDTLTMVSEQQLEMFRELELAKYLGDEFQIKGNSKSKLNVVSLFTGAGGMDIGFKEAGFNCIFASDIMLDYFRKRKLKS